MNGKAIYGTRPVAPCKEGMVCLTGGKGGEVYLIYLGDEDEEGPPAKVWLSSLCPSGGAEVRFLGVDGGLNWKSVGKGVLISIPDSVRSDPPCRHAWTIRISPSAGD